MADDLIFFTNPMSRGRIVRWMLEEVGEPYETRILDYATTLKGPEYLAINPMGKVPAIKHGDVVVTEGAAICAYLADAFAQKQLAPAIGDPARGTYYRWLFFAAGPIEQAVGTKMLGVDIAPEQKRMMGFGDMSDTLNAMEVALDGRQFLLGDRFSAADVFFGSQVAWGLQFGSIEKRPTFTAYAERIQARPAYKRASEIDDKALAGA